MSVNSPLRNGALEAALLRNVLDTVTHDLGGLSSALALRADVMQRTAPSAAATACSAIANELRSLGGQLREMSGPRGGGTLSPTPSGSLERWLTLIQRFGQPLLGRGVALHGEVSNVDVGALAAHELTYIVLAILHAVREGPMLPHTEIRIASDARPRAVCVRISAHDAQAAVSIVPDEDNEWWSWAMHRAADADINLLVTDGQIELLVSQSHGAYAKG